MPSLLSSDEDDYEEERDPRQRSMKSFLPNKSKNKRKKNSTDVFDDVLGDMLIQDVPSPSKLVKPKVSKSPVSAKKKIRITCPSSSESEDEKLPIVKLLSAGSKHADPFEDALDVGSSIATDPAVSSSTTTTSNTDVEDTDENKTHTNVYWYDCCEGQAPGTVFLFGKLKKGAGYVSCCVIVRNIKRTIYLRISPNCTFDEVVGEFTHITAKKCRISNFKCTQAVKNLAFDLDQIGQADFVQVDYPAHQMTLPSELKGETFDKIFNVNQSPMEKLILNLKLRGPCWLRLLEPVESTSPLTWTQVELQLDSPDKISVEPEPDNLKQPYFSVMSISLQTHAHPTVPGKNDIIAISVMVNTTFNLDECLKRSNKASGHFLIMTKPPAPLRLPFDFDKRIKTFKRTKFELVDSERDLLTTFMDKFSQIDPDIVVGHDLLNFDFETLVKQMVINKVGTWSRLGRFKRSKLVSTKKAFPYLFSGRVLCDIKKMAEELMQLRSYDLNELTAHLLDRKRIEYSHATIVESFKTSEGVINLLNANWEDVDSIFSILVELNIIPLALKITNITGNILSRTLAAGRSERNEYLLLHAFHEANFICPEKQTYSDRNKQASTNKPKAIKEGGDDTEPGEIAVANVPGGRRKPAYVGGLVLEPKAGFYQDCILLMDFNSLYPSIIQEFNICFSTVKEQSTVPDDNTPPGILPAQLKSLVDRRRRVKKLMAACDKPMQKALLDIEQRALKLTANSMYGCLGFEYSRFYAKHLASMVTFKGREILSSTKALVEKLGYDVIYGDTDSLMIDTKTKIYDEVIAKGNSIKESINMTFKLLEIDIDGVFRPLLLLKKKNYAGASISKLPDGSLSKKIETKGLDSVRRDRAVVAKEASDKILSMIMESDKDVFQIVEEIHSFLKELAASIKDNLVGPEKYLISKQLNKNPEDYRETKGIGHVTIALRYNQDPKRAKKLRAGDVIDYVICIDGSKESANQRCYTLEEVAADGEKLKIDHEYYLCQQIYPAISRICDKLPLTNAYAIAEALGIETNSSIKIQTTTNDSVKRDQLVSRGEARFNTCEPMLIHCPFCNYGEEISRRIKRNPANGDKLEFSLTSCSQCAMRFALKGKQVDVQILGLIKKLTQRLYNPRFTCGDCEFTTRNVFGSLNEKGQPICNSCGGSAMSAELDDHRMDLQLNYYKFLLDIENDTSKEAATLTTTDDTVAMYRRCYEEVSQALRMSFINTIDAQRMFSMVCSTRS